jgi:Uma2 family endonuclease
MQRPANVTIDPKQRMSDDKFFEFCMAHPDERFERSSTGEITIVPPAGGESSYQSLDAARQLGNWAIQNERGKAFDSSAEFILPTRAALSPDAAWVSNARLAPLSREQRRKFLPVCPGKEKMIEWARGGVELGWLIHSYKRTVYIYRAGQTEPESRTGILKLSAEGPVAGFE